MPLETYKEDTMHPIIRWFALSIAFCAALHPRFAHAQAGAPVVVNDAWVRATVPAQKATGAFMRLRAAADSKLVAASSPAARIVEVHEMAMQGDVMRMRQIPYLPLPAGRAVDLTPGGYHIMLIDLTRQVKVGDSVPLALVIEGKDGRRQTVQLDVAVRGLTARAPGARP